MRAAGFDSVISIVTAGIVLGVLEITFALAFATPIFAGNLSSYLSQGIAVVLLGTAFAIGAVALVSSNRLSLSAPQDIPIVIVVSMVSVISGSLAGQESPEIAYHTIVLVMALSALITALFMLLLGIARLGKIARFIPYPVVAGLLAGTGWLLIVLSLEMMSGVELSFSDIHKFFSAGIAPSWIPGFVLALVLLLATSRFSSPLILPSILVGYFLVFHLVLRLNHISPEMAHGNGLLLGIDVEKLSFQLPIVLDTHQVDWQLVISQLPAILSLAVLACIVSMIQVSSIEVALDEELDMNRELTANGVANSLVGIIGGIVAYHNVSSTLLSHKFGVATRLIAGVIVLVCLLPFLIDASFLKLFPVSLLAGIILFLGLDLFNEWLIKSRHRMSVPEFLVVVIIFLLSTTMGFPVAIMAGLFLGAMLFVVQYSNFRIIDSIHSGYNCRSGVMRTNAEENHLVENQDSMVMMRLKGFLFFGTSNSLYEQIRSYVDNMNGGTRMMLLDFRDVPGIDTTAMMGLSRIRRLLENRNVSVFACNVPHGDVKMVNQSLFKNDSVNTQDLTCPTDHGLEIMEDASLSGLENVEHSDAANLVNVLASEEWEKGEIASFMSYLSELNLADGESLIQTGDDDSTMYFIQSGLLEVFARAGDKKIRLRAFTAGAVIGEMAIYTGFKRTADVVSRGESTVFGLSEESLSEIEREIPDLANKVHRFLAKHLVLKIMDASRFSHIR